MFRRAQTLPLLRRWRSWLGAEIADPAQGDSQVLGVEDLLRTSIGWRVVLVVLYLLVGVIIGHCEGWTLLFSLYFSAQTLTTVGYGDFSFGEASAFMQILVSVFAVIGMFVMGAALTRIIDEFYERQGRAVGKIIALVHGCEAEGRPSQSTWHTNARGLWRARAIHEAARRGLSIGLLRCLVCFFSVIACGAVIVGAIEGWSWHKSFYWSCITFTTVGYGDVVPSSRVSRLVTMLLMIIFVVIFGGCVGFLSSYRSSRMEALTRHKVLTQFGREVTAEELEVLAHGEEVRKLNLDSLPNGITRAEFCLFMLVKMGRVEEDELNASQSAFDALDACGDGVLDLRDLRVRSRHLSLRFETVSSSLA